MPRGKRPSTAALTMSGARNASEMVIFTCRTLHFWRVAICSMLAAEPETISSSQRRPRAIALTRRARRSMRVGRTSFRGTPTGMRICRDFLDGGFCQGIDSNTASVESDPSSVPAGLNRTVSRSLCTSMRITCSAINPRSSASAALEVGWPCWATRCSFTDPTMMSSMSVAGMRETDPTDTVLDSPLRCGSEA